MKETIYTVKGYNHETNENDFIFFTGNKKEVETYIENYIDEVYISFLDFINMFTVLKGNDEVSLKEKTIVFID